MPTAVIPLFPDAGQFVPYCYNGDSLTPMGAKPIHIFTLPINEMGLDLCLELLVLLSSNSLQRRWQ